MANHRRAAVSPARYVTDPRTRRYLYRVCSAAIPLLIAAGYLAHEQAGLVLALLAAVLGIGAPSLAAANTPTPPPEQSRAARTSRARHTAE
ncbi:phage holin [Dermabacteraceae bacterium CCM 9519]